MDKPLAIRMRPTTIEEVIGQEKIKSFLFGLLENKKLISMVFYGPPGTGKTTLARAFSNSAKCHYISLNAVSDNKSKMESAFEEAARFYPTIIIIDEIHRMDKGKQDILLPHLENADFYLIGCTTSNPYLSLNPAIRSRTRLLESTPLTDSEILQGLKKAVETNLEPKREFDLDSLKYLAKISAGDLRFAYNQLEALALSFTKSHKINVDDVKSVVSTPNYWADSNGDEHYNTVSAFQKSIRGSEVDAAIYYLAKLLKSGDLEGVIRRLLVTAYEDIGLANPQAVDRCYNACNVAREVGLPEAAIPLSFTVCELAMSPKSKSAALAIEEASSSISEKPLQVKNYLKYIRSRNVKDPYPYDKPEVWPYLEYLPDEVKNEHFYHPWNEGKYEKAMYEYHMSKEKKRTSDMEEAIRRAQNEKKTD